jgi:hypothetical protein
VKPGEAHDWIDRMHRGGLFNDGLEERLYLEDLRERLANVGTTSEEPAEPSPPPHPHPKGRPGRPSWPPALRRERIQAARQASPSGRLGDIAAAFVQLDGHVGIEERSLRRLIRDDLAWDGTTE